MMEALYNNLLEVYISLKILVVDDAMFMRMMIKNILKKHFICDIIGASDGVEAVELYQKEFSDLVFMDITMPVMSGIEALQNIKEIDKNAKVIM